MLHGPRLINAVHFFENYRCHLPARPPSALLPDQARVLQRAAAAFCYRRGIAGSSELPWSWPSC